MSSSSVFNMLALDYCIECITQSLSITTGIVDTKYASFQEILNDAKDPVIINATIRGSELFDKNYIIDCELLAQVFMML